MIEPTTALFAVIAAHELGHSAQQALVAGELKVQIRPRLIKNVEEDLYRATHDADPMRIVSQDQDLRITLAGALCELGYWNKAFDNVTDAQIVEYIKTRTSRDWIAKALRGKCVSESDIKCTLGHPVDSQDLHITLVKSYMMGVRLTKEVPLLCTMRKTLDKGHHVLELDQDALVALYDGKGPLEDCLPPTFLAMYKTAVGLGNENIFEADSLIS